jgi:hypothetical protein
LYILKESLVCILSSRAISSAFWYSGMSCIL